MLAEGLQLRATHHARCKICNFSSVLHGITPNRSLHILLDRA